MTRPLWLLLAVAVACLGYGVWQSHKASRWEREVTATLAVSQHLRAEADSLKGEADRLEGAADSLRGAADRDTVRLPPVLLPDTTVRDSLRFWRDSAGVAQSGAEQALGRIERYRVALDTAQASSAVLRASLRLERARGDSLESVLRRAPTSCPRLPLLGIPLPTLGIGYAVTPRGGGPAVAVVVPLGACR